MEDIFNPKYRFKTTNELYNYVKKELTDEKIKKAAKEQALKAPINVFRSKEMHLLLIKTIEKMPQDTPQKRKLFNLLLAKSKICMYNNLTGRSNNKVNAYLAKFLGITEEEFETYERKALDLIKNELDKKDFGTGKDIILN